MPQMTPDQSQKAPRLDKLRRLRRFCRGCCAGVPLALLALSADPTAADDPPQASPAARPDFRFKQPRVTLGLRGGYAFNSSEGSIYSFFTQNLTLSHSDFNGPAFAIDAGVRAISWLDVVAGFEFTQSNNRSEFRYFVEEGGASIEQKTRLSQVVLSSSLKFYPIGRGRQVGQYAWIRSTLVPYLGGGIGATWYKLRQKGDFVVTDPDDPLFLTIFEAKLESDAWTFSQHVFVGLDLKITTNFGAVVEARYHWARADIKRDFDFGHIDLDGARAMIGFNFRL